MTDDQDPPTREELLRKDIEERLAVLTPKERDFQRLRFGLDDGKTRSLQEIAVLYGISREEARKLEKEMLRKLRRR